MIQNYYRVIEHNPPSCARTTASSFCQGLDETRYLPNLCLVSGSRHALLGAHSMCRAVFQVHHPSLLHPFVYHSPAPPTRNAAHVASALMLALDSLNPSYPHAHDTSIHEMYGKSCVGPMLYSLGREALLKLCRNFVPCGLSS